MEKYLNELKKMQTIFLQEYLEIVFCNKFGNQWRNNAVEICRILYKYRKTEMVSADSAILFNKPEEFSFMLLDFTSLKSISILGDNQEPIKSQLKKNGYTQVISNKVIRDRIKDINEDRSFESHLTYSESCEDINIKIYGAISHLEKLVDAIMRYDDRSIEIENLLNRMKKRIDIFKASYSKEQAIVASIMNDIYLILDKKVSFEEMWLKYAKNRSGSENKDDLFIKFNELACNNRIPKGIESYALCLYKGICTKKDILKAYEILDANLDTLTDDGKAILATIYSDGNFEFKSNEKANELIEKINATVIPIKLSNGNVLYQVKQEYSKKSN